MNIVDSIIVVLVPVAFTVFEALFGLIVNLWKPKFDWVNETVVVKQSASVMITLFSTMALVIMIGICYFSFLSEFMNVKTYVYICLGVFILVDLGFYYLLKTWGVRRFEEL